MNFGPAAPRAIASDCSHNVSLQGSRPARDAAIEAVYAAAHLCLTGERFSEAAKLFRFMLRAAPRDERAWLGLGACHERALQPRIAMELYAAGSVVAGRERGSVRCMLARARTAASLGRDPTEALEAAEQAAHDQGAVELIELVAAERRRSS
jgi:hypothetical protein